MAFEFKLPDLGEGVAEGEVVRWLVSEGETIREEQPLVEVMTDKVTAEIPSPRAGTVLKISVPEGRVVPVGTVMVTIGAPGEAAAATAATDGVRPAPAPEAGPGRDDGSEDGGRVLAVPAIRKLARDLGVEIEEVPAT